MQTLSLEDFQELPVDESELRQVKETYATLEGYYGEIAQAGQIDRSQAQALVESCGVHFANRPLNSFTTFPTAVNLDVAMEGIGEAAIRLITDLIKKAVALLVKIAQWMVQAIKNRKYRDRQAGVVARNIDLINRSNIQLKNLGVETVETPTSMREKITEYVERVDHAYSAYYHTFSPLSHDVLTSGVHSRTIRALNLIFSPLADVVGNKIALFDEVIRKHPRAYNVEGDAMASVAQLKTIATPYPIAPFLNLAPQHGSSADVLAFLTSVYNDVMLLRKGALAPDDAVSVDAALLWMASNRDARNLPYRIDPDSQDRKMTRIKNDLTRLQQIQPSQKATDQEREAFQAALQCIQREVMALERMVALSETMSFEYDRLLTSVLTVTLHEHNLLAARGAMANQSELQHQAQQVASELKRELK